MFGRRKPVEPEKLTVRVTPFQQSEVGWRMKPGDAVTVECPVGQREMLIAIDTDGAVAKAFHVPMRGSSASRQSFLVGKDGQLTDWFSSLTTPESAKFKSAIGKMLAQ